MFFIVKEYTNKRVSLSSYFEVLNDIVNNLCTYNHTWSMYQPPLMPSYLTKLFTDLDSLKLFIYSYHISINHGYPKVGFKIFAYDTTTVGSAVLLVDNGRLCFNPPTIGQLVGSSMVQKSTNNHTTNQTVQKDELDKDLTPEEKWDRVMGKG